MTPLFSKIPLHTLNILAVDDEAFNLEILSEWLLEWGANVETAENGQHALEVLAAREQPFDVILLDRMMPQMDGFEFLEAMKIHRQWNDIPVIMQSAAATVDEVQYALAAGIWYYLSKPFERRKLYSIIETAVSDSRLHKQLRKLVNELPVGEINSNPIELQTLVQAQEAAIRLARLSSKPENVVVGLFELLVNAIEHGNLEISYNDKTRLLNTHHWMDEIKSRLGRSGYGDRVVAVSVKETERDIEYIIKDQGKGFKSKHYAHLQTHRAGDNHGRGIAFAKQLSFQRLEFFGNGNEVHASSGKHVA
ncbi:response regulator [Kaarinaea lacus]